MVIPHDYYNSEKSGNGKFSNGLALKGTFQPEVKGGYVMKKTLFRFVIASVMITGILSVTGLAQGGRYRRCDNVNRREYSQRNRIREGIHSGELTRGEASRLINQQRRIEAYERRSRLDDGRLDRQERWRLDQMLDRSNRDIYREKHDRQDRDRYRWRR
jgi:hypothetical protein